MADINAVLNRLDKVKPTKAGNFSGRWEACCPAHKDATPSLAITLTHDDRILIKCWAGCGGEEIVRALGMEWEAFCPTDKTYHTMQGVFGKKPKLVASTDDYLLAIAKADRANGRRLTASEKQAELNALMRKKRALA